MPSRVDHEFIHRKLTKFSKKIYQLGVKRDKLKKKASLPSNMYSQETG